MKSLLLLSSLCLSLSMSSQAATMLVDFGVSSRTTPGWNNFSNATDATPIADGHNLALVDTTGAGTGITLTLGGGAVNLLNDGDTGYVGPTTPPSPFNVETVTRDGVFHTGSRTLTLSGLTAGQTYDLTFYSYVNRDASRGTRFAIPGQTTQTIEPSRIGASTSGQTAVFNGLAPDGSGNIVITLTSSLGAGNNWILNGMQVVSVPEPAAALLCGAGLVPLLLRRRKA